MPPFVHRLLMSLRETLSHGGFRKYFANTSWLLAENLLRMVAGLFVGIYIARYLGPERFGIYSYALAFVALFGSVAKLGMDPIVIRELVHHPRSHAEYLGTAFWLKVGGAVATMVLIAAVLPLTSGGGTTDLYILIIASGLLFQSLEVIDFYFQSQAQAKYVSVSKTVQLAVSSAVKLYLVFTGAELLAFVVVAALDHAMLAAAFVVSARHRRLPSFWRRFSRSAAAGLLRDAWPLIFSGLAIMLYMRIDQVMIREMLGEREVGLYAAAVKLSGAWYSIPVLMTAGLFPAILSARAAGRQAYFTRLRQLYSLMVFSSIAVAVPVTVFADELVLLLYGSDYAGTAPVVALHIWTGVFVALGVAFSRYLVAENLAAKSLYRALSGAVVNIALNLVLIPPYGIVGAAAASLAGQLVATYLYDLFDPSLRRVVWLKNRALLPFLPAPETAE